MLLNNYLQSLGQVPIREPRIKTDSQQDQIKQRLKMLEVKM